ncbi:hypothetical protein [Natrarchaeobius versutus]|uniref:hypothetical protein n=1 Tax=Natrarchaeobius versutus TaxID=1679078 RepID=UPI003510ACC8
MWNRTLALLSSLVLVIADVASPPDPVALLRYAVPFLVGTVALPVPHPYGGVLESVRNES